MKKYLIILTACILAGCSSLHRVAVVKQTTHDTLYLNKVMYDSIYIDNRQVIDHSLDTVYVREILREYKYKFLRDTVRVVSVDSIPVIHEVEVVKTVKTIPTIYKWSLAICIILIIIILVMIAFRVFRAFRVQK